MHERISKRMAGSSRRKRPISTRAEASTVTEGSKPAASIFLAVIFGPNLCSSAAAISAAVIALPGGDQVAYVLSPHRLAASRRRRLERAGAFGLPLNGPTAVFHAM